MMMLLKLKLLKLLKKKKLTTGHNHVILQKQLVILQPQSRWLHLYDITLSNTCEAIDRGEEVDVIYLDFAKAFDKVPHKSLLSKLKGYGIKGKIYDWIKDFLSNRKQRVVINGKFSHWIRVTSGISQGSVLGPILFS